MFLVFVNLCICFAVLTRPRLLAMDPTDQAIFIELFLGGILMLLVDFNALQTVGMWMAIRAQRQQRAVLGTLGRVMLVPWAGILLVVFLSRAFNISQIGFATVLAL